MLGNRQVSQATQVQRGIVSMLGGGGGKGAIREEDAPQRALALQGPQGGGQRLGRNEKERWGERAALRHPRPHRKTPSVKPVEAAAGAGVAVQQAHPAHRPRPKAQPLHTSFKSGAADAIMRLLKFEKGEDIGAARDLQVVKLLNVPTFSPMHRSGSKAVCVGSMTEQRGRAKRRARTLAISL